MPFLWALGPAVLILGLVLMATVGQRRYVERVRVSGTVLRWDHARVGGFTEHGKQRSVPVLGYTTKERRRLETAGWTGRSPWSWSPVRRSWC